MCIFIFLLIADKTTIIINNFSVFINGDITFTEEEIVELVATYGECYTFES